MLKNFAIMKLDFLFPFSLKLQLNSMKHDLVCKSWTIKKTNKKLTSCHPQNDEIKKINIKSISIRINWKKESKIVWKKL